jgi:hypothetical protein
MTETPWESSPEDVAEQRAEVLPDLDERFVPHQTTPDLIPKADPADIVEQLVEVPLDEEEWP